MTLPPFIYSCKRNVKTVIVNNQWKAHTYLTPPQPSLFDITQAGTHPKNYRSTYIRNNVGSI